MKIGIDAKRAFTNKSGLGNYSREIISYIKEKIVKLKASCVFQEPQFDSKLVKIVVEGTNAQIGTLDPLGVGIKDEKDFYLQLLRNMAKSLKECLG